MKFEKMKQFFLSAIFFASSHLGAQPKHEVQEFSGVVKSFEPGYRFAYEKFCVEVNGEKDCFLFYPEFGKLLMEKIRPGDLVTVKALVNLKARENRKTWGGDLPWFLFRDLIREIKVEQEWIKLLSPAEDRRPVVSQIFIHQPIVKIYVDDGYKKGVLLANGTFFYNQGISKHYDPLKESKIGDKLSFMGAAFPNREGYVYPWSEVKEVYHLSTLRSEVAQIQSLLFKQNHVCIGAKFKTAAGKEVTVSFPSYRAEEIKKFIKPEEEVELFLGADYGTQKFSLPELHAMIQGKDTLKIDEFGFYGGADGKHEHKDVGVEGKITYLERTAKGNVASIVVNSEYYIEIDAMMSQQIGSIFRKGLMISIIGKERIRLPGEIYKKDYKIVVPEKVVVDGKTFSLYQP